MNEGFTQKEYSKSTLLSTFFSALQGENGKIRCLKGAKSL